MTVDLCLNALAGLSIFSGAQQLNILEQAHPALWQSGADAGLLRDVWQTIRGLQRGELRGVDPALLERLEALPGTADDRFLPAPGGNTILRDLIATRDMQGGAEAVDQPLTVLSNEDLCLMKVPVSDDLKAMEDLVVDHLASVIPPGTRPRVLLFGPGRSKTDPLYAIRFLTKLELKTGQPGDLAIFELNADPLIWGYLSLLQWGGHRVTIYQGDNGDYRNIEQSNAHLILSILPGQMFDTLFSAFAKNLVRGGIALMESEDWDDFSSESDYRMLMEVMLTTCEDFFSLLRPPLRKRIFRSFFSERFSDIHTLALKRR